ncbi:unnamed protein product [Parajaminaea phylloscopi]
MSAAAYSVHGDANRGRSRQTSGSTHDAATAASARSVSPSSSAASLGRHQRQPSAPRPLKVVVIGPASVGKTTLRQAYFTGRFQHNYRATIGADFEAKVVQHTPRAERPNALGKGKAMAPARADEWDGQAQSTERKVLLTVWDTAGQERFRALGSAFYRGADAAIVCFDSSSTSVAEAHSSIEEWYRDFAHKAGLTEEQKRGFCWVAVGCKADLRSREAFSRASLRSHLDALLPRRSAGSAPESRRDGAAGDERPADPMEVLAREGRHEEDDRELIPERPGAERPGAERPGADSACSDQVEAGVTGDASAELLDPTFAAGVRPGEQAARQNGREPDASCQDSKHPHTDVHEDGDAETTITAADARPRATSPATPIKRAKEEAPLQPFPMSSSNTSIAKTPPTRKQATGVNNSLRPVHGHSAGSRRERFDSTMSMASTSQVSVYHTPRSSAFWQPNSRDAGAAGSHSASADTTVTGSSVSRDGSPSRGSRTREDEVQSASLLGALRKGNGQATTGKSSSKRPALSAPADSDHTITGIEPTCNRPRALSSASIQSLPDVNQELDGEAVDASGHDHSQSVPQRHKLSDLIPAAPPQPLNGFSLFYTSSLTGCNVEAVFEHVVSRCVRQWDWEEYEANLPGIREHLEAERERRRDASKRRSFWGTLGRKQHGQAASKKGLAEQLQDEAQAREERTREEVRRMVRLSDGKGDDHQSRMGGCC